LIGDAPHYWTAALTLVRRRPNISSEIDGHLPRRRRPRLAVHYIAAAIGAEDHELERYDARSDYTELTFAGRRTLNVWGPLISSSAHSRQRNPGGLFRPVRRPAIWIPRLFRVWNAGTRIRMASNKEIAVAGDAVSASASPNGVEQS
jgi:hypothetical protein